MRWFNTVRLSASARMDCPLPGSAKCALPDHSFSIEQTAQTPLSAEDERTIRTKLQSQLDLMIEKFLEAHK